MRASYSGITSDFQSDDVGSIPSARSNFDEDFLVMHMKIDNIPDRIKLKLDVRNDLFGDQ